MIWLRNAGASTGPKPNIDPIVVRFSEKKSAYLKKASSPRFAMIETRRAPLRRRGVAAGAVMTLPQM